MTPDQMLKILQDNGAKIWVENDKLRLNAPKRMLTDEFRAALAANKATLIALLSPKNAAAAPTESETATHPPHLSFAQERLWFMDKLEPGNPVNNINVAYKLTGKLDVEALRQSLSAIVARHETLRTTIGVRDEKPFQQIADASPIDLPVTNWQEIPEPEQNVRLQSTMITEIKTPYELDKGPLFRFKLFKMAEDVHVFWASMHHIIADGWSFSVFFNDLQQFYNHFANGAPLNLDSLPAQYRDFASFQRDSISQNHLQEQLKFWKEKLSGAPSQSEFFSDFQRPNDQHFNGAAYQFELPDALTALIPAFAKAQKTSPFVTLMSIFAVLTHRFTGQEDLVFGTPNANRGKLDWENLIGCFMNPLALRLQLQPEMRFFDVLKIVQNTLMDAHANGDISFEQIIKELQLQRDLSRNPVFQLMFQVFSPGEPQLAGLQVESLPIESQFTELDMHFFVNESANGFKGKIIYNSDLFTPETIERFADHFGNLALDVLANPEKTISDAKLISDDEWRKIVFDWNDTLTDYPRDKWVHQLFEDQAQKTPDAIAIIFEDQNVTFRELDEAANRFANYLKKKGLAPGNCVGVCLNRHEKLMPALLGVMKRGCNYIPLDPAFPAERLNFMLQDAAADWLVAESDTLNLFDDFGGKTAQIDRDWNDVLQADAHHEPVNYNPDEVMYTLYTSGSTGKPKGVQVMQRNVVNLLRAMADKPGISTDDKFIAVTSLSFDISVNELYLPLTTGATMVLVSQAIAKDARLLGATIGDSEITLMQATPATWRMLLDTGWKNKTVKTAISGGEALPVDLAHRLLDENLDLWNLYGPTETTIWSTFAQITEKKSQVTIGRPIANTRLFIVDKNMQPVPIGAPGELIIAGDGVARGYHNRPELTADRFVKLPENLVDRKFAFPEIAYRTGDLSRYLPNSDVLYLGRMDQQIKLRGYRIELGEIESAMSEIEEIEQAVVSLKEIAPNDQRLIGYVIEAFGETFQQRKARKLLRTKLPNYMIPSSFVVMEKFPLTPSGKIDRKALPMPNDLTHARAYIPPKTEMEKSLASIWQQLIGVDKIGTQDNFFDVGGHSLLALQMIFKVESQLGCNLTPRDVLLQTLGQLAAICEAQSVQQAINN